MTISKTKTSVGLLLTALVFITGCNSACNKQSHQWHPLFKGNAENGNYQMKVVNSNDYDGNFSLEDIYEFDGKDIRVLYNWQADSAPYAVLATKKQYSNYDLKFQYKWGTRKFKPRLEAKRDAGLLLHIHEYRQDSWPRCIECQVQEGDTCDIWLIGSNAVCLTESGEPVKFDNPDAPFKNGRRYKLNESEDWTEVLVEVRGDSAKYYVNGMLVNRFQSSSKMDESNSKLDSGYIGLQAESAEITYRNVMIRKTKP